MVFFEVDFRGCVFIMTIISSKWGQEMPVCGEFQLKRQKEALLIWLYALSYSSWSCKATVLGVHRTWILLIEILTQYQFPRWFPCSKMTARTPATPLSYLSKNDRKKASYPAELSVEKWPARRPAIPLSWLSKNGLKKASYPTEFSVKNDPQEGQLTRWVICLKWPQEGQLPRWVLCPKLPQDDQLPCWVICSKWPQEGQLPLWIPCLKMTARRPATPLNSLSPKGQILFWVPYVRVAKRRPAPLQSAL